MNNRVKSQSARAGFLRDDALQWLAEHQRHCKDGECMEPAGLIAYLCHSLGCRDLDLVKFLLAEYDARCPGCSGCAE